MRAREGRHKDAKELFAALDKLFAKPDFRGESEMRTSEPKPH
jgi:hypothetical protein